MESSVNASLDALSATVNETLIETGRFFRSGGSLQASTQLRRAIPGAHREFQLALDNLCEQVFMAKAFLEREYEAVKAKKETTRDAAAAAAASVKPTPTELEMNVRRDVDQKPQVAVPAEERHQDVPDSTTDEAVFDSMLNDTPGGPNEFDLHLGFGHNEGESQTLFSPTTGSSGAAEQQQQQQQQQQQLQQQPHPGNSDEAGAGESSFDDLFMESDALGDGAGDGTMSLGELDSWFV